MSTINQTRILITASWLLIIAISVIYIFQKLLVVSDMQQFIPVDNNNKQLQVLLHETQKGASVNLFLVQLSGDTPDNLARLSQSFKRSLLKQKNQFRQVLNGDQSWDIGSYRSLFKYRYLLKQPDDFSVAGLKKVMAEMLSALRSGATGEFADYMLSDPQRTFVQYLSSQSGQVQPEKYHGVWFVENKSKTLLMIQLNISGFNLDAQQAGIHSITNSFKKLDDAGNVELVLSGPGTIAVATRDEIRKTIKNVSVILTVSILILFWVAYRSTRLAFMAGLPLITSIIVAMAITQLVFSEVHGIVIAFGITLLGVCLDYPLHLFSHLYKGETAVVSLEKIWPTLRLGVLTSVLAYVGLMGTGFSGLTQLALFSATGLITALLVTRWLIPVWVSADWIDKCTLPASLPLSFKLKVLVSTVVIGFPAFFLLVQDNIWSNSIVQVSPVPESLRDTDYRLRQALHAPDVNHVFLTEAKTVDAVLTKTEKVRGALQPAIEKKLISGIHAATMILPERSRQQYYQSLLPGKDTLQKNVAVALKGMPFKKDAFDDFVNDVVKSKTSIMVDYQTLYSSPLGDKLKSMLFYQDDRWYSLLRVTGVSDEKAFTEWLEIATDIKGNHISVRDSTSALMNDYLKIAWQRLLAVMGLIILVVLWQSRKRQQAIWLIVPLVSAVLVSLAVQLILGNVINIFHVLSLLLVIGMGLDYSLFFNRDWQNNVQLEQRSHAIMISAITTIITFGTLALSGIPVLAAMGQTVSVGILVCFIVAQKVAVPPVSSKVIPV